MEGQERDGVYLVAAEKHSEGGREVAATGEQE